MKKNLLLPFALLVAASSVISVSAQTNSVDYEERLNFYLISDSGRNGYYEQKRVADTMGEMTDKIEPEFIVTAGDTHHYNGVQSVDDPIWYSNFESIYTHPELLADWYAVMGNHEYHGSTKAMLDYTQKSRRWNMPSLYYSKTFEEEGTSLQLVMIDTAPLIDKYREDKSYPEAGEQSMEEQLEWLDKTLKESTADWVVVVGHHPIYAQSTKKEIERTNMQDRVDVILRKYNVDLYGCGHIHSFQHIQSPNSDIEYVVNTSGSLARPVHEVEGTQYCSPSEGFSIFSFDAETMLMHFVDKDGNIIYTYERKNR